MKRIVVDPPVSDARRDRVERKLFDQLAAVRIVERAEAVIPPERRSRTGLAFACAGAAAAAAAIVVWLAGGSDSERPPAAPSRVVTPIGDTSQLALPGALIEAQSDTSVEVQHGAGGAITLVLARGTVDCDVEPRPDRPPFRVIAGDVTVEVVGTRFTVARTPSPRIDVARGKVRVIAPGGTWLVEAGDAWPAAPAITARAQLSPVAPPPPIATPPERESPPANKTKSQLAPAQAPAAQERMRAHESYKIANKLEERDPRKAAQLYRAIATEGKGMEAVALLSLAEVQLKLKAPEATLDVLDELARRFPNAANAEDAAWFRYEALRVMGRRDEARGAAADYLRQFPNGAYVDRLSSSR